MHGSLKGGRAKNAEVHPGPIVDAVLAGLVEELQACERLHLDQLEVRYNFDESDPYAFDRPIAEHARFYCEISGAELDPKKVREARQ